jgi:hypothetical protein
MQVDGLRVAATSPQQVCRRNPAPLYGRKIKEIAPQFKHCAAKELD